MNTRFASLVIVLSLSLSINTVDIKDSFKDLCSGLNVKDVNDLETAKTDFETKQTTLTEAQAALENDKENEELKTNVGNAQAAFDPADDLLKKHLRDAKAFFRDATKMFNEAYKELLGESFSDGSVGYCFNDCGDGEHDHDHDHTMTEVIKGFFKKNLSAFIGEEEPTLDSMIKAAADLRKNQESFISTFELYDYRGLTLEQAKFSVNAGYVKQQLSKLTDDNFTDEENKQFYIKLYKCMRLSNEELQKTETDTISEMKTAEGLSRRILLMI